MEVSVRARWCQVMVVASTSLGIFLIWLLFSSFSLSAQDAFTALLSTPLWLYAVVICCTFSNQVVGALKWQVAAQHVAQPNAGPSFFRMVELTTLGALFGQLIPVQLSTLLARWFLVGREVRGSGYAARATIYEQTFDLILIIAGTAGGLAVIVLSLQPATGLVTMACVVGAFLLGLRRCLRGIAAVFRAMQDRGLWVRVAAPATEGFSRAALARVGTLGVLSLLSLLRLVLVGVRAVAVLAFFAPETASLLVFTASPGIALLSALPIAPAGLGMAEWSWSAILVLGGTAAPVAAVAALTVRLTNVVALLVVVGTLGIGSRFRVMSTEARQSGA